MSNGPDHGAGGYVDGAQADMARLQLRGSDAAPAVAEAGGERGFAPASPVVKASGDKDKFNLVSEQPQGTEDKFKVFERWLLESGCRFPKLYLKWYAEDMRGVHASQPVGGDELLVSIPLQCLITVEMGKETAVGRRVVASRLRFDAPKHIYLMLFLLTDMHDPASFYRPYYDSLPQKLNNMPIFWQDHELAYLEGSHMLNQIEERRASIQDDYERILAVAPELADIADSDQFAWARMIVCSRNFGITYVYRGATVKSSALVPYADMLNHYRPRETRWTFEISSNAFTIHSLQPIPSGGQVYDSYGKKDNHRFLLNYGFSVEDNREEDGTSPNEVYTVLTLPDDATAYKAKAAMLACSGPLSRGLRVSENYADEGTREAFAFLRVALATEDELDALLGRRSPHAFDIRNAHSPVSSRNEEAVLRHLAGLMREILGRYPTTLDEDVSRLETGGLEPFSNERNALIQVKSEKEVAHFHIQLAPQMILLLRMPFPELIRVVQSKYTGIDAASDYAHKVVVKVSKRAFEDITGRSLD